MNEIKGIPFVSPAVTGRGGAPTNYPHDIIFPLPGR